MTPSVLISDSAWRRVEAELDRVYPHEGIAVPLLALFPRDPTVGPWKTLKLRQIQHVVIAEVVLIPAARQVNSPARVSVRCSTDALLNEQVLALTDRHPRLRACGYLHSHPFARGQTRPSRGPACDYEGHMLPLLASNRECGLETSFSFIACRSAAERWRLLGFALDESDAILELGPARVIPDDSPQMRRSLLGPIQRRSPQRYLLRRWRRSLRRRGLRHRTDELFDGWLRVVIEVSAADGTAAVVLVPPDFPTAMPQCHAVHRTESLPLELSAGLAPDAWLELVDNARAAFSAKKARQMPSSARRATGEHDGTT